MIFEKMAQPFCRYGNPDMVFLETLKKNFDIYDNYNPIMFKMIIIFSFRVAIEILL